LPPSAFVKAPAPDTGIAASATAAGAAEYAGRSSTPASEKSAGPNPDNVIDCYNLFAPTLNYITMWHSEPLSGTWDLCDSLIYQSPFAGHTGALALNYGFPTTPLATVDVYGNVSTTDTRSSYMIQTSPGKVHSVLSIFPYLSGNLFVGAGTGSGGNSNTFLGNLAGTANTTGSGDTFVGDSAGAANVSNNYNTFMGQGAGKANIADYNTFVGYGAGYSNTTGAPNTCLGAEACGSQTTTNTGQYNTATGFRAGLANTTGNWNTLYGTGAGINIQTGNANTMVGVFSGFNTTGNNNTFLGADAGASNLAGSNNIYLSTDYPGPLVSESNTIRIGNWLNPNYTQQTRVFIDPILANPTAFTVKIPVLTIVPTPPGSPTEGQLGWQYISAGGGNVMGSCTSPAGGTYLTGWVGTGPSNAVGCSPVFQQATTNNIGIGTTNPTTPLEVGGDITADTRYDITSDELPVLSIDNPPKSPFNLTPLSDGNLFVGINAGAANASVYPTTGVFNTFIGTSAGASNTSGAENTFSGWFAGLDNVTGNLNTFSGYEAGSGNTGGANNTFLGAYAGYVNTTGQNNTFVGYGTGIAFKAATGQNNIFLGFAAGNNNFGGNDDIYIGNLGCVPAGSCSEGATIRIGTLGTQMAAYMQGIYATLPTPGSTSNTEVCIDPNGKLNSPAGGCLNFPSSRRFKEQILDMGESSSKLFQLRPVTFFYRPQYDDGSHLLHYGLIAEEVAQLYPEMVGYDKDGQPSSVRYQELAPMLLNEIQKQNLQLQKQAEAIQLQQEQNRKLEDRIAAIESLLAGRAHGDAAGQ
jgi:hypothetical protein